jgi:biotin operon repressor
MIPLLKTTRKVILTVDFESVIKSAEDLVAVTEDGPAVLISKRKLTDSESLLLKLLAAYVGVRLGVLDREWLSKDELQEWLGKSRKITSTRLGELCREAVVIKTRDNGGYQLSILGVKRLVEEILPQIKERISPLDR